MATDRDLSREIVFEAGRATCVQRIGPGCYRDAEVDSNFRSAMRCGRGSCGGSQDADSRRPAQQRHGAGGFSRMGRCCFVAHGALSPARIDVLDKRTGRELARVPLAGVGRLVAVPGRDELWAIHDGAKGRVVSHLAIGPAPVSH
ncbi:MAG: hypothetical protein WDO68_09370 [Gammaproteobacteria bacterium]